MAVRDKARKPNIIDRDRNIFIGIDTPIRKSEGFKTFTFEKLKVYKP